MTTFSWKPRSNTTRIILHESHTSALAINAVDILRAKGRANGLLEVGYHFVIERDGRITETRPHHVIGSHAPGCNHDSIGICLAADADWVWEEHAKQLAALRLVDAFLDGRYGILPIFGHDQLVRRRDRTHKCPSFDMQRIKELLSQP